MADGRKEGLTAAIDQAGPGTLPPAAEVMRDLFDLDPAMMSPRRRADGLAQSEGKRKPGRPKGSKNKRSQDWIEYLGSQYTMPLEALVALGDMSPDELFEDLRRQAETITGQKIDPASLNTGAVMEQLVKLLGIITDAQRAAIPYLHERRGIVVADEAGNDVPQLFVGLLRADGAASVAGDGLGVDTRPRNRRGQSNQGLIEGEVVKSTAEKSTDAAKSLNDKGDGE